MTVQLREEHEGHVLAVQVRDKLTKADFAILAPEFERLVGQRGKLRVFYELIDFQGWDAAGLWHEIKFDAKNFANIERIAIVGEEKWQHSIEELWKPFTTAEVRYFDRANAAEAREWLRRAS